MRPTRPRTIVALLSGAPCVSVAVVVQPASSPQPRGRQTAAPLGCGTSVDVETFGGVCSLESVVERERVRTRNGGARPSLVAHAQGLREILARERRRRGPFAAKQ